MPASVAAALARTDPSLARLVHHVQHNYIVSSTKSSYSSAAKKYIRFCELRHIRPWPCTQLKLCAWIVRLMTSVKPSSLKVYLAAVRFVHINQGYEWLLTGNEGIRRTLRYVRRHFPSSEKGMKIPVSLAVLKIILPLLSGWPIARNMQYLDLLFATDL